MQKFYRAFFLLAIILFIGWAMLSVKNSRAADENIYDYETRGNQSGSDIFEYETRGNASNSGSGNQTRSASGSGIDLPTGFGLPDPSSGIKGIITNALNWLLSILGVIAIISFIISGLQYFFAAGDERMMETAKRNITYSIIGIIVALSGFVIIQAISYALNAYHMF